MKTILFIDDNAQSGALAKIYLEKEDFETLLATETRQARNLLQAHQVDCILCDIGLPGENGVDFFRWLQTQEALKGIIFYFISGHAMGFDHVLTEHKDHFITKPIFYPDLVDKLKKELYGKES